jgi:hypothetical protein
MTRSGLLCGECGRRGGWIGIGGNKVAREDDNKEEREK